MTSKTVREIAGELRALLARATPGPWRAWRSGNCPLMDGTLVGQSSIPEIPRPYEPRWVGHQDEASGLLWKHTTYMRDEDADLIAAMRNALPALLSALESQTVTVEEVKRAYLQCAGVPLEEFWGCIAAALNRAKREPS